MSDPFPSRQRYALFAGVNKQAEPAYASQIRGCFATVDDAVIAGNMRDGSSREFRWYEVIDILTGDTIVRRDT